MEGLPEADPGSFRDPLSRVFLGEAAVYRGFRNRGAADYDALEATTFFRTRRQCDDLIESERVSTPGTLEGDWPIVISHPRLPFVSYPFEWSFSMLQDAALLQLSLTREALSEGLITKDATPYNVQFVGARPTFIDIGSFERLEPGVPWYGYRQFCSMFLNPLLLTACRDVSFRPWLRGNMDGIPPGAIVNLLARRHRWRPDTFAHTVLHNRLEQRHADSRRDVATELRSAGFGAPLIDAQLRKLTKLVQRLRWGPTQSEWSDYSERPHYSDRSLAAKEAFVESVAGRSRRRLAWDLGTNDGHFARIIARHSDSVIAVDADELAIERLYRQLKEDGSRSITPIVMDLIDATPSQGWQGAERSAFFERTKPDLVLALAVVHHLAISGTIPIPRIIDWLANFHAEVVLEVPHEDDPMVKRLLARKRTDLFTDYRLETFDRHLEDRFTVHRRELLPDETRTMYHLVPR